MFVLPNIELLDILEPAYSPCPSFFGACEKTATWRPRLGHVPRGFLGATGSVGDIELVLLIAEPGDPYENSAYDPSRAAESFIAQAVDETYQCFDDKKDFFHRNIRSILELYFRDLDFDDQLRRTWITETYLCSAPEEGGSVPAAAEKACGETYLKAQLELLAKRPIIALGDKAKKRVNRLKSKIRGLESRLFYASAASPPESNKPRAVASWEAAVKDAHKYVQSSPRSAIN